MSYILFAGIILILSFGVSIAYSESLILAPLQQLKNGLSSEQITCIDGLKLVLKKTNDNPACVKPKTLQKLVDRSWAQDQISSDKVGILVDTFTITLADNDRTLELYSGDRIILNLSTKYTWKISTDNQTVLRASNQILEADSQAVYESFESGTAILSAIGTPICLQETQSCNAPEINFILHVLVL